MNYNTEVLKSKPCDYNGAYILEKIKLIIGNQVTQVAFKNCEPFTNCLTKINGATIDDAEDLDLVPT